MNESIGVSVICLTSKSKVKRFFFKMCFCSKVLERDKCEGLI